MKPRHRSTTLALNAALLIPTARLGARDALKYEPASFAIDQSAVHKVVMIKSFLVFLRRTHEPIHAKVYQRFIDPAFIEEVGGLDAAPQMNTAPVVGIENIQLALDGTHAIAILDLEDRTTREVWLLEVTEANGTPFIRPVASKETTEGTFDPWKLRVPIRDLSHGTN